MLNIDNVRALILNSRGDNTTQELLKYFSFIDLTVHQVCTVEKQNVIIIWTISRSLSKMTDSAAAPWSKIKFFINQIINIAQLFSK